MSVISNRVNRPTTSSRDPHYAATTTSDHRLLHLDGLRCLAFLAVFLYHTVAAPLLWAGVDLFFVLSGYLITGILIRSKEVAQQNRGDFFRTFYLRRLLRISPPYYIFIAIFFITEHIKDPEVISSYVLYVSNFNSAFEWDPVPHGLGPMWSLAVEEQFYLLWPLLVWCLNARQMAYLSVGFLLFAPLCRMMVALYCHDFEPAYYLLPCRIDLLSAGCLLAMAQTYLPPERFTRLTSYGLPAAVSALACFLTLAWLDPDFRTNENSVGFNGAGYSLILIMAAGIIAYLIPRREGRLGRLLSIKPLVFIGTISYTLYLTHDFLFWQVEEWKLPHLPTVILAFALTLLTATVSWYFLELPLQRLKSRVAPYRRPVGPE